MLENVRFGEINHTARRAGENRRQLINLVQLRSLKTATPLNYRGDEAARALARTCVDPKSSS
jgi:hypothetical protein